MPLKERLEHRCPAAIAVTRIAVLSTCPLLFDSFAKEKAKVLPLRRSKSLPICQSKVYFVHTSDWTTLAHHIVQPQSPKYELFFTTP